MFAACELARSGGACQAFLHIAPQREDQGKRVLRHGMHGVVADIGDDDAVAAAMREVDIVDPRRRHRDHLKLRQACQHGGRQRRFVDDGDTGLRKASHRFLGADFTVLVPSMRKRRAPDLGVERAAFEENNLMHGWL